jgi:hypothetical protein
VDEEEIRILVLVVLVLVVFLLFEFLGNVITLGFSTQASITSNLFFVGESRRILGVLGRGSDR